MHYSLPIILQLRILSVADSKGRGRRGKPGLLRIFYPEQWPVSEHRSFLSLSFAVVFAWLKESGSPPVRSASILWRLKWISWRKHDGLTSFMIKSSVRWIRSYFYFATFITSQNMETTAHALFTCTRILMPFKYQGTLCVVVLNLT